MMSIALKFIRTDDQDHVFAYRVSEKKRGIVYHPSNVSVNAAELRIIQYFLQEESIFQREFIPRKGYGIHLSKPLYDALKQKELPADLNHLRYFVYFLSFCTLQRGDPVFTNKDCTPPSANYLNIPGIQHFRVRPYEFIPFIAKTVFGPIIISPHSVTRFITRESFTNQKSTEPVLQLKQMLENPNLKEEVLPDRVLRHKYFAYPGHELPKVFGHPASDIHFLTLFEKSTSHRYLISIYIRHPDYNESEFLPPEPLSLTN